MVRTCCAAAILIAALAPLAWSEDDPPAPADEPMIVDLPDIDAEASDGADVERLMGEHTREMLRLYTRGQRQGIQIAPYSRRAGSWTCPAGSGARPATRSTPEGWDPCELGRRIAEMPPCLGPKDCQALQVWQEEIGPPVIQEAEPLDEPRSLYDWTLPLPAAEPADGSVEDEPPSRD